jgi:hypothetical protein
MIDIRKRCANTTEINRNILLYNKQKKIGEQLTNCEEIQAAGSLFMYIYLLIFLWFI